jgi:prenylcysteine oxidase / farnesylcysteine lyase
MLAGLGVVLLAAGLDVAIIGGGIGGGAAAYYTSLLRNQTDGGQDTIRVFETRDYLGGRLKHTYIEGNTIELGGDAWSSANQYVLELCAALGINTTTSTLSDPITANIGVWDGGAFLPLERLLAGNTLSELRAALAEGGFLRALKQNYALRGQGATFRSVDAFLRPGSLDAWTTLNSSAYFGGRGIDVNVQTDFVEPLLRVIYDQGLSAHAFASLVALTSAVGSGSVAAGNSELVAALFARANAVVALNTTVTTVRALADGGYFVETALAGGGFRADKVVLACPIEFADIRFDNITLPPMQAREFEHWYVTVVRAAAVDPAYFGLPPTATVPENVLTKAGCASASGSPCPFNVIQLEVSLAQGDNVYKLFSNTDVQADLDHIFQGVSHVHVQHWPFTFPKLKPVAVPSAAGSAAVSGYQPIVLHDEGSGGGILYLNTMESVASAMEGSVIAGRNAAMLIAQSEISD